MPARGLQQCNPYTCTWKIERGKVASILAPSPKGKMPKKNYARKTDSILSFLYTQKSLHLLEHFCGASSPSLGPLRDLQSMGQHRISSLPSPGSLRDLQGVGHQEVDENSRLDSRRYGRNAHQKDNLVLS